LAATHYNPRGHRTGALAARLRLSTRLAPHQFAVDRQASRALYRDAIRRQQVKFERAARQGGVFKFLVLLVSTLPRRSARSGGRLANGQGQESGFSGVALQDTEKDSRAFLEEFKITYPNGRDESGKIAVDYGTWGIPESFFIDAQGGSLISMSAAFAPPWS
jgi:hypothetical protein